MFYTRKKRVNTRFVVYYRSKIRTIYIFWPANSLARMMKFRGFDDLWNAVCVKRICIQFSAFINYFQ